MFSYEIQDVFRRYARKTIENGIEHTLDLDFNQDLYLMGNQAYFHYDVLNRDAFDKISFLVTFTLEDDFLGVNVEYATYLLDGKWVKALIVDDEFMEIK